MKKENKERKCCSRAWWKILLVVIATIGIFAAGYIFTDGLTVFMDSAGASEKEKKKLLPEIGIIDEEPTDDGVTDIIPEQDSTVGSSLTPSHSPNEVVSNPVAPSGLSSKSSAAEVVKYFNTSANKVKSVPAKSVTWVYEDITLDEEYSNVPAGLEVWLNPVNKIMKTSQKNEVYSTQEEIINEFGVEGETWSSKLTADAIKEYSCEEKDGSYRIKLVLKDEPTPNVYHGEGYAGKAFYVLKKEQIELSGLKIKNVEITYHDCTIDCTIDKDTGNLTEITYTMPLSVYLEALGMSATIGFTIKKNFTVQW